MNWSIYIDVATYVQQTALLGVKFVYIHSTYIRIGVGGISV